MSTKQILPAAVLIFSLLLIVNLSRELFKLSKSGERIRDAEEKVEELKLKNWQLKQEREYRESNQFLEKEIRDKLMRGKEGEVVVILPKEEIEKISSQAAEKEEEKTLAIWQQWLEVFGVKI